MTTAEFPLVGKNQWLQQAKKSQTPVSVAEDRQPTIILLTCEIKNFRCGNRDYARP